MVGGVFPARAFLLVVLEGVHPDADALLADAQRELLQAAPDVVAGAELGDELVAAAGERERGEGAGEGAV